MERKIEFSIGEYYHLYNRGVEKREIFRGIRDYERFHKLLFVSNSKNPIIFRDIEKMSFGNIERGESLVAVGAYCLMPNHFHILVKEITQGGLTSFMGKLATAYSMYFNKVHERIGPLFQSRFKAEHVDREESLILSGEDFPVYFEKTDDFKEYITDWLKFSVEERIFKDEPERKNSD